MQVQHLHLAITGLVVPGITASSAQPASPVLDVELHSLQLELICLVIYTTVSA